MGTAAIIQAIEAGLPALIALFSAIHGGDKTAIAASTSNAIVTGLNTLASNSTGGQQKTVAAIIPLAQVMTDVAVEAFQPAVSAAAGN